MPKYTLVATIKTNAIICTWDDDFSGKISNNWYHPHCKIAIVGKCNGKADIHARLSHALQIALQDACLRPSQLRYFALGCGCKTGGTTSTPNQSEQLRKLRLFDEDGE